MKKLLTLILSLLIAQLAFSQTDTINNKYPVLAYPKYVLQDTCVLLTPYQAKLAKIDAINADMYKEELDSCKHVINDYQSYVNLKNDELSKKDFEINVRNEILYNYKLKEDELNKEIKDRDKKLKMSSLAQKITYPIVIVVVFGLIGGLLIK